ncbi:MAG: type II toxin-antitoxin system RelE/ParE family toxin [Intrasporangium sp.]|uniref:type II toxin-antitoxin system RelE/ParE family toxin n=1 Tax=Intrasporangium sp. TaxID=1925024 RepID=UPI00264973B9|nr:type II toxin-antitoxin system RelE/ParE family toxin [Intrasporangium sp.]MDN5797912.1 type II toxin-antitoxin system RelE/ParE family toxin [Intrasporangium sp.]
MTLDVSYHPEALAELRADVGWYEARGIGLGDRFESSVDDVLDALVEWPESGAVWPGWDRIPVVRSRRLVDFPYRLVYIVQPGVLVVVALAHQKRKPGYWRDRVAST